MGDIDEDALNVLLAEGIDAPTAYAGALSEEPREPQEPSGSNLFPQLAGLGAGIAFILYWYFGR